MKTVFLLLVACLVGIAMVAVGVAGVAGAFDDDSDGGSGSISRGIMIGSSPADDVTDFDRCRPTDPRFGTFTSYELAGPTGTAAVLVSCQGGTVELSLIGASTEPAPRARTVALWLFQSRDVARLVAAAPQEAGELSLILSGQVPSSGTELFPKLVVTEEAAGDDDPAAPAGRVLLQASF